MSREIVIGIDGGGSNTRVIAVDLSGRVLAYIEEKGANPYHNAEAKSNIRKAILEVLKVANRTEQNVALLVAGLAGIDRKEDYIWAQEYVELPGLEGKCLVDSDALIAQIGAFKGEPGIIAISGTGSVTYGINEEGKVLCNYDFLHFSSAAARYLSFEVIHRIIGGQFEKEDLNVIQGVLEYWEVEGIEQLSILASKWLTENEKKVNRKVGNMAPLVTEAAEKGSPLARTVCDHAAYAVVTGIYLVGSSFKAAQIPLALIGSVLTSPYMKASVQRELSKNQNLNKQYHLKEPELSPIMGAVLLAFQKLELPFNIRKEEEDGIF